MLPVVRTRFDGRAFIPQESVNLQAGTEVTLRIEPSCSNTLSAWEEFWHSLEPLSAEQLEVLEQATKRRPLFEGHKE